MKKLFTSIMSLTMASLLTFGATGCTTSSNNGGDAVTEIIKQDRVSYYGTHEQSAVDTDRYLVKNGVSDYVVVLPEGAKSMLLDAKNDLLILFKKATGVALSFKYDSSVDVFDTNQHYISLGETKLVRQAGIDKSEYSYEKLKSEGIRIITKDNTVFLLGGSDFGVNNAVYKFLEIYFNFDYYYRDCIDLDVNVTDCKFKNIDVTDVPDIDHFFGADHVFHWGRNTVAPLDALGLGAQTAEEEVSYKHHRAGNHASSNEMLMRVHLKLNDATSASSTMHNVLTYLPKCATKCDCHSSGNQLCYTAHGNAEVLQQMVDTCAEKIIFSLKTYTPDRYPYMNYISFTMEDNSDICHCQTCKEEYKTIGYSGSLIKFSNKIGEKVDAWLEAQKDENAEFHNAYRENFHILIFGYNAYTDPPVDENGAPLCEEVVCHKRIGVWHASSRGVSAHADVYDPKWINGTGEFMGPVKQILGWKEITKNSCLWFWHNSGNVVNNDYFSDGFTIYSNNFMELMAYAGYEYIYAAHFLNGGSDLTCWQNLLVYVQNKLRWDCHRNMDDYIKKYMNAMFQDASDIMYDLLQDEIVYYQKLVVDAPENNNWGRAIKSKENYPYSVLLGWLQKCDNAINEIETLKETNQDLYTLVKHRIEIEASAHIYRIINMYGNDVTKPFSDTQLDLYKQRLRSIGELSPGLEIKGVKLTEIV
jgi:hypothetical protein